MSGNEALVDLPLHQGDVWSEDAKLIQMLHRRPTPASGFMPHLAPDQTYELIAVSPLLSWLARGGTGPAPPFPDAERAALIEMGVRFLAVHPRRFSPVAQKSLESTLNERIGDMAAQQGMRWWCWDLKTPTEPPT